MGSAIHLSASTPQPPIVQRPVLLASPAGSVPQTSFGAVGSQRPISAEAVPQSSFGILGSQRQTTNLECASGHTLLMHKTSGGSCDVCGQVCLEGTVVWDCRLCNWHTCRKCA